MYKAWQCACLVSYMALALSSIEALKRRSYGKRCPFTRLRSSPSYKMAHTTLASTDRALEKIGDFVEVQDYPSLKAVGRTFAQKAAVLVGLRRSIPRRYAKKAKRRLPAVNSHAMEQRRGLIRDDAATVGP